MDRMTRVHDSEEQVRAAIDARRNQDPRPDPGAPTAADKDWANHLGRPLQVPAGADWREPAEALKNGDVVHTEQGAAVIQGAGSVAGFNPAPGAQAEFMAAPPWTPITTPDSAEPINVTTETTETELGAPQPNAEEIALTKQGGEQS